MANICVVGLQWGDEAKGKLVDLLTEGRDVVVRYQGGANAGHTIVIGDQKYVLHHIPSGIINPGALNVVTAGVVINPETILKEINSLTQRSIDVSRLVLSDRAHLVCPWHIEEDRYWSQVDTAENSIGTTLRGIGPCYADKVGRRFALRLGDIVRDDLPAKIKAVVAVKKAMLDGLGATYEPEHLDAGAITECFLKYAEALKPFIGDTNRILLDAVDDGKTLLFEGAQGSLLDIDHGTFPFVTSSNSSGVGISAGSGVPAKWINRVIGVLKSYNTRVGGGPFPTEQDNEIGQTIRDAGNEYGSTTGRPRRCGWFDAIAARYTARLSGADTLALMMLDVLSELDEIQVCVGYKLDGQPIDYFPAHFDDLQRLEPVYETLPGWRVDITGARSVEDLPQNAKNYVDRISVLVGKPVEFISVGPDRAQTITCQI